MESARLGDVFRIFVLGGIHIEGEDTLIAHEGSVLFLNLVLPTLHNSIFLDVDAENFFTFRLSLAVRDLSRRVMQFVVPGLVYLTAVRISEA